MEEKDIDVLEHITQLEISRFIKNNRNLDKKEIAKKVDKILTEKEKKFKQ